MEFWKACVFTAALWTCWDGCLAATSFCYNDTERVRRQVKSWLRTLLVLAVAYIFALVMDGGFEVLLNH